MKIPNWPFPDYEITSLEIGKTERYKRSIFYQVQMNHGDMYFIVREVRFLWFTFIEALHYGGSLNGLISYDLYKTPFNTFDWDVKNRCIKKWNGGEEWMSVRGELGKKVNELVKAN